MSDPVAYLTNRLVSLMPGRPVEDVLYALESPMLRRQLTKDDPLAFALIYLRHHLQSDTVSGGRVTLSEFHEDLIATAKLWMRPMTVPRQNRHAFVAPREVGKSTWCFTILPMWAAAHGHAKFIAAFSDSATQAETHLSTFKHELESNAKLRMDFPDLCEPAKRRNGTQVADRQQQMQQANGFVFAARGLETKVLGLKVNDARPDLLLLDDIEPGEGQYTIGKMAKRLITLQDDILPLNEFARVMLTGTVTMPGSLVHQLVRSVKGEGDEKWITDERFITHYWPGILANDDGTERSVWPEKWPLEGEDGLLARRHERAFLKNFMNAPLPTHSAYWTQEDIRYGDVTGITRTVLSIDPAVTSKVTSDQTGLAVVGWSDSEKKCLVEHAEGVRLIPGEPLRAHVLKLLAAYPHVSMVIIEGNQGQDVWHTVLHDLPVFLKVVQSGRASKAQRAAWSLLRYQQGRVIHAKKLTRLEEQQLAFTGREGQPDDICDAVNQAVNLAMPPVQAQSQGIVLERV